MLAMLKQPEGRSQAGRKVKKPCWHREWLAAAPISLPPEARQRSARPWNWLMREQESWRKHMTVP